MAGSPAAYVLDSFALLAYLEGEAGMARVAARSREISFLLRGFLPSPPRAPSK